MLDVLAWVIVATFAALVLGCMAHKGGSENVFYQGVQILFVILAFEVTLAICVWAFHRVII